MDYKYPTPQLLFKAICNAIRSKTGNSDEIPHQNIPDELDSIIIDEEEYNIEMQRFIDIIEGTSFVNDRITTVKVGLFSNCTNLTTINLPKCTFINYNAFYNCTGLATIILSNNQMVTLEYINTFNNSSIANGTGYIYVPDNLVNSYKTITNWPIYADQIKPLSELPSNLKEEYGYD